MQLNEVLIEWSKTTNKHNWEDVISATLSSVNKIPTQATLEFKEQIADGRVKLTETAVLTITQQSSKQNIRNQVYPIEIKLKRSRTFVFSLGLEPYI